MVTYLSTDTLLGITEITLKVEIQWKTIINSFRRLQSILQFTTSQKGVCQRQRAPDHTDDSSVQWRAYSQRLQSNRTTTTHHNSTTAATLKLDRNYLIVSRRKESYAEMNSEEYLSCPGTPQLKLCTKPVALVSAQDKLCLTDLPG